MKSAIHTREPQARFKVLETRDGVQTAFMSLRRGQESGPLGNEHPKSVQVLVVICGQIEAQVGERRFRMGQGDSVIVQRDVAHRFVGISDNEAVTLNVYSPAAYDDRSTRDRSGEVFQDAFTENGGAPRAKIEDAQHALEPEG